MTNQNAHANTAIERTRAWVKQWVIDQGLCPFAARPWQQDQLRLELSQALNVQSLLEDLDAAMLTLEAEPAIETLLLIHPEVLADFAEYNDFLDLADALIEARGWQGIFQVASFHPLYQFADAAADAVENYTNRSPFPMLHVLREASVEAAIDQHPDIDGVPIRNIEHLQDMGLDQVQRVFSRF